MDYTGVTKVKRDPRWNWRRPVLPPMPPEMADEVEALGLERLEAFTKPPEPEPAPEPAPTPKPTPKPRKTAKEKTEDE